MSATGIRVHRTRAGAVAMAFGLGAAMLALTAGAARADIGVEGDATDLTVTAEGESLAEVAEEIAAHLEIDLTVPEDLESAGVNGTYRGSLASVLKGLMPHASFIISRRTGDARGVTVRFLGVTENSEAASARPSGKPAAPPDHMDGEDETAAGGPPKDRRRGFQGRRAAPEDPDDPQSQAANSNRRKPPPPPARQVY